MWCWGAGGKENGATRGCLVNAELVNYLWKNTIVMRDSTGQWLNYTKRVNRLSDFT